MADGKDNKQNTPEAAAARARGYEPVPGSELTFDSAPVSTPRVAWAYKIQIMGSGPKARAMVSCFGNKGDMGTGGEMTDGTRYQAFMPRDVKRVTFRDAVSLNNIRNMAADGEVRDVPFIIHYEETSVAAVGAGSGRMIAAEGEKLVIGRSAVLPS